VRQARKFARCPARRQRSRPHEHRAHALPIGCLPCR
jgi:hypothetical protein